MYKDDLKVLLIEDYPPDAYLVQRLFKESFPNGTITCASTVEEGLEVLSSEAFDLIIMDLELPGYSGLDSLKKVTATVDSIPIIVMSGLEDEKLALEAIAHKAQDYLVKGGASQKEMLSRSIRYAIERHRLQTELNAERLSLARRVEERTQELQQVVAELKRSSKLKDEFLASMSHELRTPLAAILGLAESIQEGTYGPVNPAQKEALNGVLDGARHLLSLINDILDLSKIRANKLELELEPVLVDEIAQAALAMIREQAHRKKQRLAYSQEAFEAWVYTDFRRLRQILVNLLSNAHKFTPEGGKIGLQVRRINGTIEFCVWDTGIGIEPKRLESIFEPFVQVDGEIRRRYEGTGLGLALVKQLSKLLGAKVGVESELNQGSRFTVSLPEYIPDQPSPDHL